MKHVLVSIVFLAAFLLPASMAPCAEPSLKQAIEMFQAGKTVETLQAVQDYLKTWPNEPRGLFLQGLILERLGRIAEAMNVYQGLINTHPEFPEPYNNLAGLLASQGRLEEAKETLQKALQTHPSYAAAHQNLSKIYSAMASQAYRRVLGTEEAGLQVSLATLEELSVLNGQTLLADSAKPRSAAPAAQPDKPAAVAVPPVRESLPVVVPSPVETLREPMSAPELAEATPRIKDRSAPETGIESPAVVRQPTQPAPPESPKHAEPQESDVQQQVKSVIEEWAKAWAKQDVRAYLSFYSSSFVPEGGASFEQWKEQRKVKVAAPPFIRIVLSDITVTELEQGVTQVYFSQRYRSNIVNDQVRKELLFKKDNGQWRIIRERLRP